MKLFVYDCEVFAYDWLVIFKDYENKVFTVIHNDEEALKEFIDSECDKRNLPLHDGRRSSGRSTDAVYHAQEQGRRNS